MKTAFYLPVVQPLIYISSENLRRILGGNSLSPMKGYKWKYSKKYKVLLLDTIPPAAYAKAWGLLGVRKNVHLNFITFYQSELVVFTNLSYLVTKFWLPNLLPFMVTKFWFVLFFPSIIQIRQPHSSISGR